MDATLQGSAQAGPSHGARAVTPFFSRALSLRPPLLPPPLPRGMPPTQASVRGKDGAANARNGIRSGQLDASMAGARLELDWS